LKWPPFPPRPAARSKANPGEGKIAAATRIAPALSCVRRTTTGKSNNRSTTEKILWQDEKWLRADLPQTDLNATGIPVFFKLPDNLPESTARRRHSLETRSVGEIARAEFSRRV
jgi:hypothetical protein